MMMTQWELSKVLKIVGCGTPQCATNLHYLLLLDILIFNEHFERLSKFSRTKWLFDYIISHSSNQDTTFLVCGKVMCQKLWVAMLGISQAKFYSIRRLFVQGVVSVLSSGMRSPLLRTNEALASMENYFTLIGDSTPHRMVLHLPSILSKLSIYQRLLHDFQSRGKGHVVSQSPFFKLWESHFGNVIIPKVKG